MSRAPIAVEIWSDVQCVWCYIASARFRGALSRFDGDVEVSYRSFELTPDAPMDVDRDEHIRTHGMPEERMNQILAQLTALTGAEGLPYAPELTRPTNSRLALELLHHADSLGLRPALLDRLFVAYFAEGHHVGRVDDLVRLASEVGIGAAAAREALESRRFEPAVEADRRRARELGIRGVPFYVVDHRWAISGAQSSDTYLDALEHAARVT